MRLITAPPMPDHVCIKGHVRMYRRRESSKVKTASVKQFYVIDITPGGHCSNFP